MALDIALIVLGIALLLVAGDLLVRGAVSLATAIRIPALLVSLTIVAFGTSAPELVVTIQAVLTGSAGIAMGNIIGSNVANVLLVLGLPAVVYPISAHVPGLRRHGAVMLVATAAFMWIAYTRGGIDMAAGIGLFAGIVAYIAYTGYRAVRRHETDPVIDDVAEYAKAGAGARAAVFLVLGLIGLPLGAHLLVSHGSTLAVELGVRQEVIGLTIVAIGTSLPELATVMAAALHKKSDVALGGIVGSNIFNLLAVGGAAGLAGGAAFDVDSLRFDIPIMAFAAALVCVYIFLRRDIGRISGFLMAAAYLGFIVLLALNFHLW